MSLLLWLLEKDFGSWSSKPIFFLFFLFFWPNQIPLKKYEPAFSRVLNQILALLSRANLLAVVPSQPFLSHFRTNSLQSLPPSQPRLANSGPTNPCYSGPTAYKYTSSPSPRLTWLFIQNSQNPSLQPPKLLLRDLSLRSKICNPLLADQNLIKRKIHRRSMISNLSSRL